MNVMAYATKPKPYKLSCHQVGKTMGPCSFLNRRIQLKTILIFFAWVKIFFFNKAIMMFSDSNNIPFILICKRPDPGGSVHVTTQKSDAFLIPDLQQRDRENKEYKQHSRSSHGPSARILFSKNNGVDVIVYSRETERYLGSKGRPNMKTTSPRWDSID